MKKRRIFAGFAAAALAVSMLTVSAGAAADPGTAYSSTIGGGKITTFDKYLTMKTDATVPTANFSFTIAAGEAVAAGDDTMPILAGVGTPTFSVNTDDVNVRDNVGTASEAKVTFSSADSTTVEASVGTKTVTFQTTGDGNTADEIFATKTVSIDFSSVVFPEPGIYRYIITESNNDGATTGTTNDTVTTRTLDVYVVDASSGNTKTLNINSYVLHTGLAAPKKNVVEGQGYSETAEALADKSTGFTNNYETEKLTFSKTVTGNQGSKDKYFKFDVTISNATGATVTVVGKGTSFDAAPTQTSATVYTAETMAAANAKDDNATMAGQQLVASDGTITATFYLQHGQSVEIDGLPKGAAYTIAETPEDYTPSATVTGDIKTGDAGDAEGTAIALENNAINDTFIKDNAVVAFTNDRTGTIPTGVILSIAAPAAVGAAVVGALVILRIKRKREDSEE